MVHSRRFVVTCSTHMQHGYGDVSWESRSRDATIIMGGYGNVMYLAYICINIHTLQGLQIAFESSLAPISAIWAGSSSSSAGKR